MQTEYTSYAKNKGSHANLAKFNTDDTQRLTRLSQFSEGVNIPQLRTGIFRHVFGNECKADQRIERFLRLDPEGTATVHLLMYRDTVDKYWATQVLVIFDPEKISYVGAIREFLGVLNAKVVQA